MRDWMIALREQSGHDLRQMAHLCDVGYALLRNIEEDDWITHPGIANKIAVGYGMNVTQRNQLCAEIHHIKNLPTRAQAALERRTDGRMERRLMINASCINSLLASQSLSKAGVSARLTYTSDWLRQSLIRGTMLESDIRRLARILGVKPAQLMATKPD